MSAAFLRLEGLILIPSVLLLFVDPLLVELLTAAGVRINFDFRASQKGLKSTVIPPPVVESSATSRGSTAAEVQQQAWKQTHFWTLLCRSMQNLQKVTEIQESSTAILSQSRFWHHKVCECKGKGNWEGKVGGQAKGTEAW